MLTPKQRQYLKGEAHHLKPVVHIGKGGATPALVSELDIMLDSLELVKIKLNHNTFEDEQTVIDALTGKIAGLEHVWSIGKTLLFFRASRTKATKFPLPSGKEGPSPKSQVSSLKSQVSSLKSQVSSLKS